jgi:hypothetical protein
MPKSNAEKLGIAPGSTLTVLNAPEGDPPVLGALPEDVTVLEPSQDETADIVVLFAADAQQLHRDAPPLFARAGEATKVWIAYRKGRAGDLSRDALMPAFVDLGWHGVSLISLDAVWSAARFRRLEQISHKETK